MYGADERQVPGLHRCFPVGIRQFRGRLLEPGDVAEDEHASFQNPLFSPQRPAVHADMNAFRGCFIAHKQLDIVRGLAVQGQRQRTFFLRDEVFSIGLVNTVLLRPFIDVLLLGKIASEPLRDRVVKQEPRTAATTW